MGKHRHLLRAAVLLTVVLLASFSAPADSQQTPAVLARGFQGSDHSSRAKSTKADSSSQGGRTVAFVLKTTAFPESGLIPKKYTCDGTDVSPALSWNTPPEGTQSFALIVDDPDAPVGTWTHWVIWNIPAKTTALPESVAKMEEASGALQGKNDFKRIGYGGPCPPPGKPHRYFFKLYALDTRLELKAGASKNELERAIKGHILAQAELVGKYAR